MEQFLANKDLYQRFLDKFCPGKEPISESTVLPFRLNSFQFTKEELHAEVCDWVFQFLESHASSETHINSPLFCYIAKTVAKKAASWDLDQYLVNRDADCDGSGGSTDEIVDEDEETTTDDTPVYDSHKVARRVFQEVIDLCEQFKKKLPEIPGPKKNFPTSYCAIKNTRRKMEDRHVILPKLDMIVNDVNLGDVAYYAVFDGHGGTDAASYAAAHLHDNLARHEKLLTDTEGAMADAFRTTDDRYIQKAKREGLRSGSTGVTCVLKDKSLNIAWLGDSQVVMVKGGKTYQLMDPHKPEREDEKKRIEDLGGFVMFHGVWRVNGTLAVSRAIGVQDFKPFVSGEPSTATFELDGTEEYIVLACDGLWDTIKYEDIQTVVHKHLQDNPKENRATAARMLVDLAKSRNSSDNISCVVVFLKEGDLCDPKQGVEVAIKKNTKPENDKEKEEFKEDKENRGSSGTGGDTKSAKGGAIGSGSVKECSSRSESKSDSYKRSPLSSNQNVCSFESPDFNSGNAKGSPIIPYKLGDSPVVSSTKTGGSNVTNRGSGPRLSKDLSDASSTDLALLSHTATKCVNARKAKRNKNPRRKNLRDLRRNSKENQCLATRTNQSPPLKSTPIKATPQIKSLKSTPSRAAQPIKPQQSKSKEELIALLTGCSVSSSPIKSNPYGRSRWTVAVEMEGASSMFGDC